MALFNEESMREFAKRHAKRERIRALLEKYPDPWVVVKEPHDYEDGTKEFTHVEYRKMVPWGLNGEAITVEIGRYVTPDLAELLVLLREWAIESI